MSKPARQIAFEVLLKIEKDKAYSNLVLDSAIKTFGGNSTDCAFVTHLVYGVIERKITLDYVLSCYLNKPINKLKKDVLTILRLGAYQILFSEKTHQAAAVNESVELAKNNNCIYASGMINAVLRKVSSEDLCFDNIEDDAKRVSLIFSATEELVRFLFYHYGKENTVEFLKSALEPKKVFVKVNTTKISTDDLIELLKGEGILSQKTILSDALLVSLNDAVYNTECYKKGYFHVEDLSSQLCVKALDLFEGAVAIDVCAAPGGKTFSIAEHMNNKGKLYSCDIYKQRTELIKSGAQRLGLTCIEVCVNNAEVFNEQFPLADRVLCDVPCSGLGIIGKKPEIKYKKLDDIKELIPIQKRILETSSKYVKKGGRLVYSTCSVNPNENRKVCDSFLKNHPEFASVKVLPEVERTIDEGDYLTLMLHTNNCDGFFIALFERK